MTPTEAYDAILRPFGKAWREETPALNGGEEPAVDWPNVIREGPPLYDGNEPWARVTVRHTEGEQHSLGQKGGRIFERKGVITVQVFVPAGKRGLELAGLLGTVALNAFEGVKTPEGVVFHRVTYKDVGPDGAWYQVNVTAAFEYDHVK